MKIREFVINKIMFVILVSIVLISFNRCDFFINPQPGLKNLLKNPSFEINKKPSFAHWQVLSNFVGFSNDTPMPGSKWSAELSTFDPRSTMPVPLTQIYQTVKFSGKSKIYNFSFWAKLDSSYGGKARLVDYKSGKISNIKSIVVSDSSWKKYTIIDTLTSGGDDSLTVQFWGGSSYLSKGKLLVDICSITAK